jgi:hypothetical protein
MESQEMKTARGMAVLATSFLATILLGCRDHSPVDRGPEPITVEIGAEITGVLAFSGSTPAGIAEGQTLTLTLTFLSASARPTFSDSIFAVYTLDPDNANTIRVPIGTLAWRTPLHQVLLHNDAPFLGDRIAVNGSSYGDGLFTTAMFDFKDSTVPYDMLSNLAFPRERSDIRQQAEGIGGGMLQYSAGGNSWRIVFRCKSLAAI